MSLIGCSSSTIRTGTTSIISTPLGFASGILGAEQPDLASVDVKADIPVFLVSGRNLLDSPNGVNPFGNTRSKSPTPHLAIATVGVGEGLTREQIIRETISGSTGKKKTRFELKKIDVQPPIDIDHFGIDPDSCNHGDHPWLEALRNKLDQGKSRNITIYVHGFNTHLVTNTEFAAEFDHFGARDGAVISFEWPSAGRVTAYMADKGNAHYSTRVFRGLLAGIAKETDAKQITIIAHSAGNPIVVNALRDLRLIERELTPLQLQEKYRIARFAMAAPDMDMMAFFNAVFDGFYEVTRGVAVYVSPNDKALDISGNLFNAERLGKAVEGLEPWEKDVLTKVNEIEMVDVSEAERKSKGLGHSYFHQNPWVSSDIGAFMEGLTPRERQLTRQPSDIFWQFPPNFPELIEAASAQANSILLNQ